MLLQRYLGPLAGRTSASVQRTHGHCSQKVWAWNFTGPGLPWELGVAVLRHLVERGAVWLQGLCLHDTLVIHFFLFPDGKLSKSRTDSFAFPRSLGLAPRDVQKCSLPLLVSLAVLAG